MNTVPKDPDPRILKYLSFVEFQRYDPTDAEIARKFRRASAKEVFEELKGYGFPVCEVCGVTPVVGEHCKTSKRPSKARSAKGERQELPSVKNAATIFRDTIATLEVYLEHMLSLKESRQGGYYIDEGETEEDHIREARGG
jgi:hypothetical protein